MGGDAVEKFLVTVKGRFKLEEKTEHFVNNGFCGDVRWIHLLLIDSNTERSLELDD